MRARTLLVEVVNVVEKEVALAAQLHTHVGHPLVARLLPVGARARGWGRAEVK